jgi:glycine/D-amino acid oxidase-like deaminating enzyme
MRTRIARTRDSSSDPESGETTTQVVLAIPIVLSLVLMAVQGAIYIHTAHVASASAARGATAGAAMNGGVIAALDAAVRSTAELSAQLAQEPQATIGNDLVVVTVNLRVPQVAPFFHLNVSRTAVEPRERFVPENER